MFKKALFLFLGIITLTTAVYAYNYDTNLPLPGKSIADTKLQENTLFTAYMFAHRVATPDCKDFAIVDTSVSEEKVDNKWQEIWTIRACSKTAVVPINFELKENGATYAIDPMGVRVISNQ
ncbi:hypothetical protein J6R97_06325 [bacterium]|jgi:hypothetical protein|nr:hypothetical protein [bacterium]